MKVIGKTVSGKTTFVAAFTEILIKYTPIESYFTYRRSKRMG